MKRLYILMILVNTLLTSFTCKKSEESTSGPALASASLTVYHIPLFVDQAEQELSQAKLTLGESSKPVVLKDIVLHFSDAGSFDCISTLSVVYGGIEYGISRNEVFGSTQSLTTTVDLKGSLSLTGGTHVFRLKFGGKSNSDPKAMFELVAVDFIFENGKTVKATPVASYPFHSAMVLRAAGQDNVNTYRIPGLTTTNKGTLIAVYDNRYNNSSDLQGDIDIGMSRSTDGGRTWEPMKVIMDMGEWGGLPQSQNGIGDPCVLVDKATNTLWVAALWFHGNPGKTAWGSSQPGLTPNETGQFMLVKSEDDGKTWSEPLSITSQVKNPAWYLMFQGPGNGISLNEGTLVFPAQFKDELQVPHSTIIYSQDHGLTWHAGTGAKTNTTESQVVQLVDGSLMLNMRDDRNRTDKSATNGRAVSVTTDLGKTWTVHPTSNLSAALQEPNCQASLISAYVTVNGQRQQVLFFSNPNNTSSRSNMTIKASLDQGLTWPSKYQLEINATEGYGYSCMTMVDSRTIGILYEGTKNLIFQKIDISDIIK